MTTKPDTKEQIWIGLFLLIPTFLLSKLSDTFATDSFNKTLLAGLFGGLGGLICAGCLVLFNGKSTATKSVAILLLTGLSLTAFIVTDKLNKPALQTCEVCGYEAINNTQCAECSNLTWDEESKNKSYTDKQQWLKEEQLFWFSLDSSTQQVDFYSPEVDKGFKKDKSWKPTITQQDLVKDFVSGE